MHTQRIYGGFAITRGNDVVVIEMPSELRLEPFVVFDNQKRLGWFLVACHNSPYPLLTAASRVSGQVVVHVSGS